MTVFPHKHSPKPSLHRLDLLGASVYIDPVTGDIVLDPAAGRNVVVSNGAVQASDTSAYKDADESLNTSITLQDDNELSVSLLASSKYTFKLLVFVNNVNAAEGFKAALGGTVGVTSLKAQITLYDDTTDLIAASGRVTALASAVGAAWSVGNNWAVVEGSIETSTAGTLLLSWAQQVSGGNNTTVQRGSWMQVAKVT